MFFVILVAERDVENESSDPSGGDKVKVEQQDQQISLNYKRIWESSFTQRAERLADGRACWCDERRYAVASETPPRA